MQSSSTRTWKRVLLASAGSLALLAPSVAGAVTTQVVPAPPPIKKNTVVNIPDEARFDPMVVTVHAGGTWCGG